MPLCCLEFKFSYLRTCKSHSIVNTCWHKFHARSHLVHAQQVIIFSAAVDFFDQEAKSKSTKQANKEREQKSIPANTVQFMSSTNPQPRTWRWHTFWRSVIDEPTWNSESFDVRLLTREIKREKHLATHTYTNAHIHHVDAHSLVRWLYCPLSNQWCEQIVKTPWWTHKTCGKQGTSAWHRT